MALESKGGRKAVRGLNDDWSAIGSFREASLGRLSTRNIYKKKGHCAFMLKYLCLLLPCFITNWTQMGQSLFFKNKNLDFRVNLNYLNLIIFKLYLKKYYLLFSRLMDFQKVETFVFH